MRADRLLSMMLLLQSRGRMTAQELASALEVSERTVYRDVDALSIAGVPVYTQSGTNGGVFLDEHYRVSLTGLNREQVLSLFASSEAGPLEDIGMARAVEDSLIKLFAALPSMHQREVEKMRQRFHIDPTGWFSAGDVSAYLRDLQLAVWEDYRVQIEYQSVGHGVYPVTVDAVALVSKSDQWYMVGRKPNRDYRTYRLSRFHALALTDEHFERDPEFDLAGYWQQSRRAFQQQMEQQFKPYKTKLQVHAKMLWYFGSFLEGRWRQLAEADEAGWIPVEVLFGSIHEASAHIMGLADTVRVISPVDLRQHLVEMAQVVVQQHSKPFDSE
ncbi:MAG: WYL domain-containing protein [Chloroflexota bacterium]